MTITMTFGNVGHVQPQGEKTLEIISHQNIKNVSCGEFVASKKKLTFEESY
ncbi:hypothetical protein Tsp_12905 [Trichinella spiralis]|uniref:hypothetical protein n=1 Tax=Trichinella spiralis TaxID=6334 RepID=UPI0001EFD605|nr:hypothetical protein Tsp_12905 [Trichinella spiralis]